MDNQDDKDAPAEAPEETNQSDQTTDQLSEDETTWGMIAHLSALAGLTGIPFANVLGPLIVWLTKKDEMPFVDQEGKEALNFQISVTVYIFVALLLCFVLIGFLLLPIIGIGSLVLTIIAGIKAKDGKHYEYPFIFRLVD